MTKKNAPGDPVRVVMETLGMGWRDAVLAVLKLRGLNLAKLTPETFAKALSEIEPLHENPLDALAAKLKERLPELF